MLSLVLRWLSVGSGRRWASGESAFLAGEGWGERHALQLLSRRQMSTAVEMRSGPNRLAYAHDRSAPSGATVNSPRRKPWEHRPPSSLAPDGATERVGEARARSVLSPHPGLGGPCSASVSRGSRPGLVTVAPTALGSVVDVGACVRLLQCAASIVLSQPRIKECPRRRSCLGLRCDSPNPPRPRL